MLVLYLCNVLAIDVILLIISIVKSIKIVNLEGYKEYAKSINDYVLYHTISILMVDVLFSFVPFINFLFLMACTYMVDKDIDTYRNKIENYRNGGV